NFAQTVALICEHTDKGALGIVLNKPLPMKLSDVLSQMKLEPSSEHIAAQPVLRGGPVHTDRGFVLHRPGGQWDHTHKVSDSIQVTTSRDVLAAMARGEGPSDAFIALGYAGWESGQPAPRPAAAFGRAGPDWERIAREVRALAPELLVVGAPYNAAGGEGELSAAVRAFAAELERRFSLPVALVDERFSSLEAGAALKERRASGQRRRRIGRADVDSAAAAVILARWFAGEGEVR